MPSTHKRVAFSAKQKKEQLQAKRERKKNQELNEEGVVDRRRKQQKGQSAAAGDDDSNDSTECSGSAAHAASVSAKKLNQQPVGSKMTGYDPNRYKLQFRTDTNEDVKRGAAISRQTLETLPEESLEINLDEVYEPGTVLDMPKRPEWDYSMTRQQLDAREERYFQSYVEGIFSQFPDKERMSYFELNLETWRQLWRVIEMSDMILLITDIRHPALHFSPSLYNYVVRDLKKHLILVLNKIDLAPPALIVAWKEYFRSRFPQLHLVCFTSYPKDEEERSRMTNDPGQGKLKVLRMTSMSVRITFYKSEQRMRRRKRAFTAVGPKQLLQACEEVVAGNVDLGSWREKIEADVCTGDTDESEEEPARVHLDEAETGYEPHRMFKDGIFTIGCCGYPNVGKSSLINGLVGKKVVSVSRTPGHTKHFQTIFLTQSVKLCDSPGLVFPSIVSRPLQILSGIFPIAQLREPYTTIKFLAERIPLVQLLKLKHPEAEPKHNAARTDLPWSAYYICDAWAEKRGFMTAKAGRNDVYRAANHILRMAAQGKLCLCMRPPLFAKQRDQWASHADTAEIERLQEMHRKALHFTDSEDSECASENSDEEKEEGTNDSEPEQSSASANRFALLSDD